MPQTHIVDTHAHTHTHTLTYTHNCHQRDGLLPCSECMSALTFFHSLSPLAYFPPPPPPQSFWFSLSLERTDESLGFISCIASKSTSNYNDLAKSNAIKIIITDNMLLSLVPIQNANPFLRKTTCGLRQTFNFKKFLLRITLKYTEPENITDCMRISSELSMNL